VITKTIIWNRQEKTEIPLLERAQDRGVAGSKTNAPLHYWVDANERLRPIQSRQSRLL